MNKAILIRRPQGDIILARKDDLLYCPEQKEPIPCGTWCPFFKTEKKSVSLRCRKTVRFYVRDLYDLKDKPELAKEISFFRR